jgi:4-amino-4-deoxy-L-arabinose transferase-like glycosyltransferase
LLTIDPLLVLFWTAAMIAVGPLYKLLHRSSAAWDDSTTLGVDRLWLGLGFLSKYTAALQIVCFAILLRHAPESRAHLRRPGPYLALIIFAVCTIPVFVWNAQHNWITVDHVGEQRQARRCMETNSPILPGISGTEGALLNPVFFVGVIWALFAFRARKVGTRRSRPPPVANGMATLPLWDYCFCMGGARSFLVTRRSHLYKRVFANWIAASVVPLFCLMVLYWHHRAAQGWRPCHDAGSQSDSALARSRSFCCTTPI